MHAHMARLITETMHVDVCAMHVARINQAGGR